MSNILVNTAYFPPVQYFTKIHDCTEIWIEQYESYGKQSYRNRCDIMTANGVMTLSVPVVKGSSIKILTKDVQILLHELAEAPFQRNRICLQKFPLLRLLYRQLHAFLRTEREVPVGSQYQNSKRAHG